MALKRIIYASYWRAALFLLIGLSASIGQACEALRLGNLSPGDSMKKVIQEYGRPVSQSKGDGFIVETYQYFDVVVSFDEDGAVANVTAKSSKACDRNNICIGTSWQDAVRRVKGKHVKVESSLITQFGDSCWMTIGRRGDSVGSLALNCQP